MEETSTSSNEHNKGSTPIIKTPKSEQSGTDVRRWASVVKAHKNILNSPERNRFVSGKDEPLGSLDCLPDIISENYESHKGFITSDKNSFFCQICSLDVDTMLSLTNHLKTRRHEDNVIVFLKRKLPPHLEHMMEFVSFCKSELCCNLCEENIDMSLNPHETILNIIAHNMDTTHASQRANRSGHTFAHDLLNIFSETQPDMMENLQFVDKTIMPHFKCKLCNKNINYNENVDVLKNHFISHFKSVGHVKNQEAVEVLKLFDEISCPGNEKFVLTNGNILCSVCNVQVETDIEKLILHVKGFEHASRSLAELKLVSPLDVQTKNEGGEGNETCVKKSFDLNPKFEIETTKKVNSDEKVDQGSNLNRLVNTLPPNLREIDYLVENDKGSIICLICNCIVPSSTQNLLIHIDGNNHRHKMESKKDSKLEKTKNQKSSQTENREPPQASSLKLLLKLLPENLGNTSFIVANNRKGAECLVCQYYLPLVPNTIAEHLKSLVHKTKESQWIKKCSRCPCSNSSATFMTDILKIPKDLRVYKCKNINTTDPPSICEDYSSLLKKHTVISNNKDLLVINVDGKNCYCKLCKNLIPLSSDVKELENNLVCHLLGKTHILTGIKNLAKKLEEVRKTPNSSTGKVVRSLFVFSSGDENKTAGTEVKVCEPLSSFDGQHINHITASSSSSLETKSPQVARTQLKKKRRSRRKSVIPQLQIPQLHATRTN